MSWKPTLCGVFWCSKRHIDCDNDVLEHHAFAVGARMSSDRNRDQLLDESARKSRL